jgi:CHASE2 domain-containing sensor protein
MRPVLIGFLLLVDGFAVASLAIARPGGWFPPFVAFGSLLLGLAWFEAWAVRHRRDDG